MTIERRVIDTSANPPDDFRAQPYDPETSGPNVDFGFTDEQESEVREAAGSVDDQPAIGFDLDATGDDYSAVVEFLWGLDR